MTDKSISVTRRDLLKKATGSVALIASTAAMPGIAHATTEVTKRYAMV
ncbi:MAG: twin-arginine translocation signal domain-containing protein, partial [Proteobacteria bacterium]|nr:twin-arginine translocation signal domain-containing protein [Pseudomonadota bacterium]